MNDIKERVVSEFRKIVQIGSLSLKENEMFSYLKKRLSGLPVNIESIPYTITEIGAVSENMIVKLPANESGRKKVFFDAHVDTVEPGLGINPVIEKGRIKSSGGTVLGADDKAGVSGHDNRY